MATMHLLLPGRRHLLREGCSNFNLHVHLDGERRPRHHACRSAPLDGMGQGLLSCGGRAPIATSSMTRGDRSYMSFRFHLYAACAGVCQRVMNRQALQRDPQQRRTQEHAQQLRRHATGVGCAAIQTAGVHGRLTEHHHPREEADAHHTVRCLVVAAPVEWTG